jgi:N-methylhydantoinase A
MLRILVFMLTAVTMQRITEAGEKAIIMWVGIDTGGTFTDCVGLREGKLIVKKILSSPHNPAQAALAGLAQMHSIGSIAQIVHGTTVATNALLERKVARTALITSAGFSDLIAIGRQNRPQLYALFTQPITPLILDSDRFEINERVGAKGEIIESLDLDELNALLMAIPSEIEAFAVCFLFSYRNPSHEKLVTETLRSKSKMVSASHEILPEYREYERFSTTLANASLQPIMHHYLHELSQAVDSIPCRLIQSNGGSISLKAVAQKPINSVLSGPAGGLIGAWQLGKKTGIQNLLTLDMGGTSTDVALINGDLPLQNETLISGIPIKVPMLAIHTVGAGGGSILKIDEGSVLRVGPQSAGANPGPVCYGKGKELTVTDAQVYLGRIPTHIKLGGQLQLKTDTLNQAFSELGKRLGLSAEAVALGAISVANVHMERALRVVSIEKGQNPADFTLFSFGGAGGLHACELAESLKIERIMIPANAGVFSALGMLFASEVRDYAQTVLAEVDLLDTHALAEAFKQLNLQAEQEFERSHQELKCEYKLDLRYPGQSYELSVPWQIDSTQIFHELHHEMHHFSRPEITPELVAVRLRASLEVPLPQWPLDLSNNQALKPDFHADIGYTQGRLPTPFYQRELLPVGQIILGPAVILEKTATTLVIPNWLIQADTLGNLILERNPKNESKP